MRFDEEIIGVRNASAQGESREDTMRGLRDRGFSKSQSIFIMAAALQCGAGEVKRMVHYSPTWADRREADELFDSSLSDAVESAFEEQSGSNK